MYYVITTPDSIPMQMPESYDLQDVTDALRGHSTLTKGEYILWTVRQGRMTAISTAENGKVVKRLTADVRYSLATKKIGG